MKFFDSLDSLPKSKCAVALGCFDGVHIGHTEIIKNMRYRKNKLTVGAYLSEVFR